MAIYYLIEWEDAQYGPNSEKKVIARLDDNVTSIKRAFALWHYDKSNEIDKNPDNLYIPDSEDEFLSLDGSEMTLDYTMACDPPQMWHCLAVYSSMTQDNDGTDSNNESSENQVPVFINGQPVNNAADSDTDESNDFNPDYGMATNDDITSTPETTDDNTDAPVDIASYGIDADEMNDFMARVSMFIGDGTIESIIRSIREMDDDNIDVIIELAGLAESDINIINRIRNWTPDGTTDDNERNASEPVVVNHRSSIPTVGQDTKILIPIHKGTIRGHGFDFICNMPPMTIRAVNREYGDSKFFHIRNDRHLEITDASNSNMQVSDVKPDDVLNEITRLNDIAVKHNLHLNGAVIIPIDDKHIRRIEINDDNVNSNDYVEQSDTGYEFGDYQVIE